MNHLPSERKEASGSTRAGGVGHSLALGAGNGHESRNRFPFELPNHIMMEMWEQCDEAFTRLSGAAHTSLWEVVTERDLVSAVYKSIAESCKNPKSTGVVYTPRAVIRYMFNQMDYSVSYPSSIFHASTWNKQEDEFVPPARGSFVRPLFDPAVGSGGFISEALVRVRTCILNLKWWTMSNNHPTVPLQKFVYLRRAICSMLGSIVGVDIDFFSSRVATTNFFLQLLPLFVHLKAVKDQVNVEAVQKVMRNFMNAKKEKQVKFLQPLLKEFLSLKDASFSAPLIACGNAMDLYTGRNVQMEVLCDGIILPLRYDYVIANPPYVSLSNDAKRGTGSAFDVHSKNPFWKKCELVSQKLEHFMLEIALSKTNDGGKVCFIIPRSWMTSTIENNVKRIMLEQNIQSISFLPQGVFAGSAEVQTLVLVLEKSAASKYVKVFDVEIRRESGSLFQTAVANKVQSDLEVLKPWSFRSAKWLKAHEDVERRVCHPEPDNVQLGKLVSSTRGVETGNTKSVRISETEVEVLIGTYGSREKTKELRSVLVPRLTKLEMCPFVVRTELVGTETQCYLLKDTPAKPLSSLYRTILKERPGVTKKEAGFGYAKKLKDQLASIAASDARIIYQLGAGRKALHVGRRIRPFCLDDSGKVVENNFRILSPRLEHKGTLKYLLGLLNSQVAQYVYSEIHFNAQQRDEHINLEDAKACELMVVTGSDTNQKRMAQMVSGLFWSFQCIFLINTWSFSGG
jgi:tRNA1(Val) A37 N6-methylase TrmN6